jgi:hypothetical protein
VFGITSVNGTAAKFRGVRVKWSPSLAVTNQEYTVIAPGQQIEVPTDLSGVYDLSEGGTGGGLLPFEEIDNPCVDFDNFSQNTQLHQDHNSCT